MKTFSRLHTALVRASMLAGLLATLLMAPAAFAGGSSMSIDFNGPASVDVNAGETVVIGTLSLEPFAQFLGTVSLDALPIVCNGGAGLLNVKAYYTSGEGGVAARGTFFTTRNGPRATLRPLRPGDTLLFSGEKTDLRVEVTAKKYAFTRSTTCHFDLEGSAFHEVDTGVSFNADRISGNIEYPGVSQQINVKGSRLFPLIKPLTPVIRLQAK